MLIFTSELTMMNEQELDDFIELMAWAKQIAETNEEGLRILSWMNHE